MKPLIIAIAMLSEVSQSNDVHPSTAAAPAAAAVATRNAKTPTRRHGAPDPASG
jgi:hypothetical protein